MEQEIKNALNIKELKTTGKGGGGCINAGECYKTEIGLIFVKHNSKSEALRMFEGEFESLKSIQGTNTVRVPKPMLVVRDPKGGAALVMEYLEMSSLNRCAAELGQQLALMHLNNHNLLDKAEKCESRVGNNKQIENGAKTIKKFGFHCTTCCGFLPQNNSWCDDWVEFYTRQKLQYQIDLVAEKHNDRDLKELWPQLQRKIPEFFKNIEVKPSLLHGDLWGGNAAEFSDAPVIFDPASFFGHSEYDLAIAKMFGGFGSSFFSSYHKLIPKEPGFELRQQLYQLFHYLNHWNHFGSGYKSSSISTINKLIG